MKNFIRVLFAALGVSVAVYVGSNYFLDGVKVVGVILERHNGKETIDPDLWQYQAERPLIKQKAVASATDNRYRFKSDVPFGYNRFLAKRENYSALTVVNIDSADQLVKLEMPSAQETNPVSGLDLYVSVTDDKGSPVSEASVVIDRKGNKEPFKASTKQDGRTDAIKGYLTADSGICSMIISSMWRPMA
ncbi:MAG: hypothetical protein IPN22_02490 [Bacteroidetes bacterium]|nr:hypothetical protein [Bacteroidota bacterium]